MEKDLEKVFEKFQMQETLGFLKTTEKPASSLTSEQKVGLIERVTCYSIKAT